MKGKIFVLSFFLLIASTLPAQVSYPYALHYFSDSIERQVVRTAYMDEKPAKPNGKTVVLLHGKNFNGYYWKNLIPSLLDKGFRVIVPDQPGWGRSDKPDLHYSFHLLAGNTQRLLSSLQIDKVTVIAHSMGGMLGIRFSLMHADMVEKLVLENPIGLEDYKTFVPYQPVTATYKKEKAATYESYKKYQQSYYPEWKPEYEQYVAAQAEALKDPDFERIAWVNAVTYQMIYEQPVVYELGNIKVPVLLIIGQADRTIVGKDLLSPDQQKLHGQYPELGKAAHRAIKNSQLVELKGVGHIPHIQSPAEFEKAVFGFIE